MTRVLTPAKQLQVFVGQALLERKSILVRIVLALGLLSLSQAAMLLIVGPIFNAIFSDLQKTVIYVRDLMKPGMAAVWPALAEQSLSREDFLLLLPALLLAAAVLRGLSNYHYQYNQQALTLSIGNSYRDRVFAAILKQSYAQLLTRSPGEWMSLIMNDVTYLQSRLSDLLTALVKDSIVALSALLTLYVIHWPTALFVTIASLPIMLSMGRTGKRIAGYAEAWQKSLGTMSARLLDMRRRFEFIRAQGGEDLEVKRFEQMNQAYYSMIRRSILTRSAFAPGLEFMGFALLAGVMLLVGKGLMGAGFKAGELFQFLMAVGVMLGPLKHIGEQISRYHETKGILKQSMQTLADIEGRTESPSGKQSLAAGPLGFRMKHLRVGYGQGFVLEAHELSVRPGEAIAIIGPSGGGKSTLLKTLSGLYKPELWDADCAWEDLHANAVLVSQSPFLFTGSIRENLEYGLKPSALNTEDMVKALQFVGLEAELLQKGQGLDTALNFLQSPLSGGQMQRLTIARGMLRPQRLVLMDEVTSAIDPAAEEQLTRSILQKTKAEGRTLLYVTHRLSQLKYFDQVWFCEAGHVTVFADDKEWQKSDRLQRFLREES